MDMTKKGHFARLQLMGNTLVERPIGGLSNGEAINPDQSLVVVLQDSTKLRLSIGPSGLEVQATDHQIKIVPRVSNVVVVSCDKEGRR